MANKARQSASDQSKQVEWPYGVKNYVFFAAALVVIVIGFFALGAGSITLAPILLVIGYCVLIPIALIIKGHPNEDDVTDAVEVAERE